MSDSLVMRGGWSYLSPSIEDEHDLFVGDVSKYPKLQYSMKEVGRAGESLTNNLYWTEDAKPEILHIFSVVNSYRNSHLFPMRSIRFSVLHRMKNLQLSGFTAARPKRLVSIRKKLIRHPGKLDQIQDLAGCRAILDDISGVRTLVSDCINRLPHKMVREYNYIDDPKSDGYRCHHLVFRYNGKDESEAFHGRRVEIQIRTRLQHSWATAVEAVGLFRNEDMKGGEGDSDWLRLFFLMSLEFAITENCPLPIHVQNRAERLREISDLNDKLDAITVLENLRRAFQYIREYVQPKEKSRCYLIRFSMKSKKVTVEPYFNGGIGSQSLHEVEMKIEGEHGEDKVALVEVDKIEKLVEAYPNYFGDVHLFLNNLAMLCQGHAALEYSMAPQEVAQKQPHETPDLSWLTNRHRLWDEPTTKASRFRRKRD